MKNNISDRTNFLSSIMFSAIFVLFLSSCITVEGYKNYTVGDSSGWYDNLENPKVDYQNWVSTKTFTLGDFLIFNTNNNHSVIQTYNFTTYNSCDYDDSFDNDNITIQWSSANPSSTNPVPISVSVPLLRVGLTYFFSGDYDGDQCRNGQHFNINVTQGQGLPPSLKSPSADSPAANSPNSGDGEDPVPETMVPSNFDHPNEIASDNDTEHSVAVSLSASFGVRLCGVLILVGHFLIS